MHPLLSQLTISAARGFDYEFRESWRIRWTGWKPDIDRDILVGQWIADLIPGSPATAAIRLHFGDQFPCGPGGMVHSAYNSTQIIASCPGRIHFTWPGYTVNMAPNEDAGQIFLHGGTPKIVRQAQKIDTLVCLLKVMDDFMEGKVLWEYDQDKVTPEVDLVEVT